MLTSSLAERFGLYHFVLLRLDDDVQRRKRSGCCRRRWSRVTARLKGLIPKRSHDSYK